VSVTLSPDIAAAFEQPVVVSRCDEPEGVKFRSVRFMPLTLKNLKRFWELASRFDALFGVEIRGDFRKFLDMFIRQGPDGVTTNGLFWVVDNFIGVFYLTRLRPLIDADVHYTFLDGRHRGRIELTKDMLRWGFEHYQLRRMNTEIPVYATKYPFQFVKELGFVEEGRKRRAALFGGKWFDVIQFGLLREELSNGRHEV